MSAIDSLFALVLGLIAFLYAAALIVVLCAGANAVLADRLSPQARLTS